jgi:hypothetical protein
MAIAKDNLSRTSEVHLNVGSPVLVVISRDDLKEGERRSPLQKPFPKIVRAQTLRPKRNMGEHFTP